MLHKARLVDNWALCNKAHQNWNSKWQIQYIMHFVRPRNTENRWIMEMQKTRKTTGSVAELFDQCLHEKTTANKMKIFWSKERSFRISFDRLKWFYIKNRDKESINSISLTQSNLIMIISFLENAINILCDICFF